MQVRVNLSADVAKYVRDMATARGSTSDKTINRILREVIKGGGIKITDEVEVSPIDEGAPM